MRWRSTVVHSSGVGASSRIQPSPLRLLALHPKGRPIQSCGGWGCRGAGKAGQTADERLLLCAGMRWRPRQQHAATGSAARSGPRPGRELRSSIDRTAAGGASFSIPACLVHEGAILVVVGPLLLHAHRLHTWEGPRSEQGIAGCSSEAGRQAGRSCTQAAAARRACVRHRQAGARSRAWRAPTHLHGIESLVHNHEVACGDGPRRVGR